MAVWCTWYVYLRKLQCHYCGTFVYLSLPFGNGLLHGYVCIWESLSANICGNTFGIFPFHLAMAVWSTGYLYLRKLKCQYCGITFGIFPFQLAMAVWSTGYLYLWKLNCQYLWQYLWYLSLPFGNGLLVQRSHHLVSCGLHLAGLYTVQENKKFVNFYIWCLCAHRNFNFLVDQKRWK